MVGLEGSPADEWLIRYAARLAGLADARLQAVYVRAIDNLDEPPVERLEKDRKLLGELGGTLLEVRAGDPASGLIQAAHQAGACQLVIGSRRRSHWSRLLSGSTLADQVLRAAGDLPVQVVNVGRPDKTSHEWHRQQVTPGGAAEPEAARNRLHSDPAGPAHAITSPNKILLSIKTFRPVRAVLCAGDCARAIVRGRLCEGVSRNQSSRRGGLAAECASR